MTAGVYLGVLLVLVWALRSRLPWTRAGGVVLGASLFGLVAWLLRDDALRRRLARSEEWADRWPGLVFVALALFLSWWTLRREQVRETPIHQATELESLARFVPRPWWPTLGLLVAIAAATLLPAPLGSPPSDPAFAVGSSATEPALSPAPFFLSGLALLELWLGPFLAWIVLPLATAAALFATPYLDTSQPETEGPFRGRRDEAPFFLWAWIGLGVVPMAAALVAPPSLASTVADGVPLAEAFWIDLLGRPLPAAWILRELPGLAILLGLFVGLPVYLPRWKATRGVFSRHLRRLGPRRYALLTTLLGLFALVPLGLLLRVVGLSPWLRLWDGAWL